MKNREKYIKIAIYRLATFFVLLLAGNQTRAQQVPMSNHYYVNKFVYNPAQIGGRGFTQTFFQARKQWVGIEGAPETYLVSVDGSINDEKVGLGAMLYNDITGIVGRTAGYGAYRYRFRIFQEHTLDLGISAGFLQNKIYFDKIRSDSPTEQSLLQNQENSTTFDASFGINYRFRNLQAGIASFQLFHNNLTYQTSDNHRSVNYKLIRHFVGSVSYTHQLNRNFSIDPQLVIKDVQGMPLQYDIGTYVNWREQAWFGVNYQHKYSLSFSVGGVLHDKYVIAYAYDLPTGNIAGYSQGGHEFLLGIRFFKGSGSKQASRSSKDFNHLKRLSQQQYEEIERLNEENKQLKQKVDSTYRDVQNQKEEIDRLKAIYKKDEGRINQAIDKYQISLDELETMDFSTDEENREFYVVLGAYLKVQDAKLFQNVLARETGLETRVVQRDDGKFFFVYSRAFKKEEESKKAIRRELRLLKRLNLDEYITGNVWIYDAKQNNE